MKNIKDLLNENDTSTETPMLPTEHRAEFLQKLLITEEIPSKSKPFYYWKSIAAACILFLGIGAIVYSNYDDSAVVQSSLFTEMKSIEDEYLKNIASEWETFQFTANDESLVEKYKERLANLDISYQELKQEFLVQKNSLTTLDNMIKNLQMRLTLLQEIQQHLKRLQDEQNNI